MINVLFLEDEVGIASAIQAALEDYKIFNVTTITTLKEAMSLLPGKFTVVISDLNLPDSKGVNTIITLQQIVPNIPIIIVSSGNECNMAEAIHFGAQDYIMKENFNIKDLIRSIEAAIERHKVRSMFKPIKEELDSASKIVQEMKNLSGKVDS